MSGWLGGIHVHRMQQGQVPVVDFLCTSCWHHRRVTGHRAVTDLVASDPITQHKTVCPAREDHP
ncbi:transcription factor WhiB [Streptomyces sp. NPDC008240]|uniref:transcription factor WhiB n=1 Tax=Streptomyces sp. NPDC008240 TaxID=3364822 RepID=UPI0036E7FA1A